LSSDFLYNEQQLLVQAASGDERAFAELFHAYRNKLYSFVCDMTGVDLRGEDVVQEVFLKIWQQRAGLRDVENFNAYIFRMCRNYVIDQLRKRSRETVLHSSLFRPDNGSVVEDPEDTLLRKEVRQKLQEAIDQLPPQQQRIFLLHKEKGLQHQEIAVQLGLSVSTVQNHLFRAVGNIREFLNTRYPDIQIYLLLTLAPWFYRK
jgi:RNA polymerase sigma-70 factor (ECF subfamily)